MPDWLISIFSFTREVSSKIALPIFITTVLILFLPDGIAATIGIDELRHTYKLWIGLFLLFSFAALVGNLAWTIGSFVKQPIGEWFFVYVNKGVFKNLLEDEKKVLRMFINDGQTTVPASINDGTINLLEHKRIIARSSTISIRFTVFPFIMNPWARSYLSRHPHLLD